MNFIKKAEESLLKFLKKELEDYKINNKTINFVRGFVEEKTIQDKLEGKEKTTYPLLIIRTGLLKQSINSGVSEKIQEMKIGLMIEEEGLGGYSTVQDFSEKVLEILTINPFLNAGFETVPEEFEGSFSEEGSGGGFWIYNIQIKLRIPVVESRFKGDDYN
jgi:hypothetical protein